MSYFQNFTSKNIQSLKLKKIFHLHMQLENHPTLIHNFLQVSNKRINKKDKPIVIIGKGVTFDTGGLNIKRKRRLLSLKQKYQNF